MRYSQPAAEARKVEGANWNALQIPNSPNPTGSVACDQVEAPSKLMLKTALTMERSYWSKLSRQGEEKNGVALKMYNILAIAKEWRSNMRASCF